MMYTFTKDNIKEVSSKSIEKIFKEIDDDDDNNNNSVKINVRKIKDGKINIIDYMLITDISKTEKSMMLLSILDKFLPKLKGDIITFIGSTFRLYGQDKPYLNHIIVLNGCTDIPEIENCVVESYDTEEKVLLAWSKLIKKEDPQFIIGYNIFGFDYPFMVDRAIENHCEDEFLYLSCDVEKKSELKESSIILASGQHDLKYIDMNGRVQVDLYNHFRKDFNLESYKLDYVAGYFMSGDIKGVPLDKNYEASFEPI